MKKPETLAVRTAQTSANGHDVSVELSHALDGANGQANCLPAIVGTLSDGAHMGGGQNGQDAYTVRIIPALRGVGVAGTGCEGAGQRHERGTSDSDKSRRFL
jgi:hypothetical protein